MIRVIRLKQIRGKIRCPWQFSIGAAIKADRICGICGSNMSLDSPAPLHGFMALTDQSAGRTTLHTIYGTLHTLNIAQ